MLMAEATIQIHAAPEAVWAKLIDVDSWPEWDTAIERAVLNKGIAVGSIGKLKTKQSLRAVPFRVIKVVEGRSYTSEAKIAWLSMFFGHQMAPRDGRVELTFTIHLDGLAAGFFDKAFGPNTRRDLPQWMKNFKEQVERS